MDEREQHLIALIERAFQGVELGDGVSLHEAQVIDNYGSAQDRLEARAPDEKHDWRKLIADPELGQLCSIAWAGLSFFDGPGLRFHLPACFSQVIIDAPEHIWGLDLAESLVIHLTSLNDSQRERLAILDPLQRACVREVLMYLREVYWISAAEIDRALEDYWTGATPPSSAPAAPGAGTP